MNINRVTLQHNKEFIRFILLFNGFITFDMRGILRPPASDVDERLKTNGTAIKFAKELDELETRKSLKVFFIQPNV